MKDNGKIARQTGRFLVVGVIATGIFTLIKVLFHLQATGGGELTAAYFVGYIANLLANYQISLRPLTFYEKSNIFDCNGTHSECAYRSAYSAIAFQGRCPLDVPIWYSTPRYQV